MKKLLYLPLAFLLLTSGTSHLFAQKDKETKKQKKTQKVKIITQKDNEPQKVMEWNGEGEMPKEMKEYLEKENFNMSFHGTGKKGKIHIKGNKKGKKGEKFEFQMDYPEIIMPDMGKLNESLEKLEGLKFDENTKIIKFDDKNFEKNMEKFGAEMEKYGVEMEKFGAEMEKLNFDNMHINLGEIEKFDGKNFNFNFNTDSTKRQKCGIVLKFNRDSLRGVARGMRALKRLERLSDLKEGTTEETKEIDLGDGKIAKITTTRKVVISQKPKTTETKTEDISASIKVFPNPNSGVFTLEFVAQNEGDARITITSNQGKQVYQEDVKSLKGTYKKEIKLSDASAPTYILRIEQGGKSYTKQIMITK